MILTCNVGCLNGTKHANVCDFKIQNSQVHRGAFF